MCFYKFRIYPAKKSQITIDNSISISQRLYNKLLEKTIEVHKSCPTSKISQKIINQVEKITSKDVKTLFPVHYPTNSHVSEYETKVIRVADVNHATVPLTHAAKTKGIKGV
ncbi:helix-turn-helix domain-containing protein [Candidatus Marsarchaeota archaeon]|nr:helix-turn-helix domain-containing protein [Candidatus Marsarchaeota archaeon]